MFSWLVKMQLAKRKETDKLDAPAMGNLTQIKEEEMSQLITKIKFVNNAKTEIHLTDKETGDNSITKKSTVYESDDIRHPDFTNIQNEMMPYIKKIFGYPPKPPKDEKSKLPEWDVEFKGVTLLRDDNNGVIFTVFVRWEGFAGGSVMNLPVLIQGDVAKDNKNKIPAQLQDAIDKLIKEAHEYMTGKRSQGVLPLKSEGEAGDEGEGEEEENTNQIVKIGKRR